MQTGIKWKGQVTSESIDLQYFMVHHTRKKDYNKGTYTTIEYDDLNRPNEHYNHAPTEGRRR